MGCFVCLEGRIESILYDVLVDGVGKTVMESSGWMSLGEVGMGEDGEDVNALLPT